MRALFTCLPGFGHFDPMVPLAQAMAAAGHEVAFATAERFGRRVVEPAGFHAFPAGVSPQVLEEQTRQLPEVAGVTDHDIWVFGAHMFARVAAATRVGDLVAIVERWKPRLVVHDPIDFAAPVAAATGGLPWASHSFGTLQRPEFWSLGAQLVQPTWRAWGLEPAPDGGMFRYLYLDICPPSIQASHACGILVRRPLRPVPFDTIGGAAVPEWFSSLPDRPTIYVTMGTVFNDVPGAFDSILSGLADAPFNVIATVGPTRDPTDVGPQPPHVHVERWVPQSLIFDSCDVVVCHGGSGTTLAALAHGVPLLLLPQGANQFANAERCVAVGAGLMLRLEEVDGAAIREAVDRLLVTPGFRSAAQRVRREIEQMPAPADVVPMLESLANDGVPWVVDRGT